MQATAYSVRRGGGTNDLGKPPEMGWAPRGPAGIADIVLKQEGVQAECCRFEVIDGLVTGSGEVSYGFLCHGRNINRGEVTRAPQARELHGITTVGFDPVAGLFGDQRR